MSQLEKSKALAKLMDWEIGHTPNDPPVDVIITEGAMKGLYLEPYAYTAEGLAQFAAILLKFPEVMERFNSTGSLFTGVKPTQGHILDEILRMKGAKL